MKDAAQLCAASVNQQKCLSGLLRSARPVNSFTAILKIVRLATLGVLEKRIAGVSTKIAALESHMVQYFLGSNGSSKIAPRFSFLFASRGSVSLMQYEGLSATAERSSAA